MRYTKNQLLQEMALMPGTTHRLSTYLQKARILLSSLHVEFLLIVHILCHKVGLKYGIKTNQRDCLIVETLEA